MFIYFLTVTFVVSFLLNFVWENAHAGLYVHHKGKKIVQKTLIIATLGDVVILFVFALLWWYVPLLQNNSWFVIPLGLVIAIWMERYALSVKRWAYKETMPIIPYIRTGVSPTIQLAVTGFILLAILGTIAQR